MTDANSGHGGKRAGAGRPAGSRMRRSDVLAEKLIAAEKCPVDALVRLAEQAEAEGEIKTAIDAWKGVLPYIYARPKPIETDPELVIELTREVATARAKAQATEIGACYHVLLQEYGDGESA